MFKFIRNILIKHTFANEFKVYKEKIEDLINAYIANINDDKSDYLKRYLEVSLRFNNDSLNMFQTRLELVEKRIIDLNRQAGECEETNIDLDL